MRTVPPLAKSLPLCGSHPIPSKSWGVLPWPMYLPELTAPFLAPHFQPSPFANWPSHSSLDSEGVVPPGLLTARLQLPATLFLRICTRLSFRLLQTFAQTPNANPCGVKRLNSCLVLCKFIFLFFRITRSQIALVSKHTTNKDFRHAICSCQTRTCPGLLPPQATLFSLSDWSCRHNSLLSYLKPARTQQLAKGSHPAGRSHTRTSPVPLSRARPSSLYLILISFQCLQTVG